MTDDRPTVVFFRTAYDTLGGGSQMLLRLLENLDNDEYNLVMLTQRKDKVAQRAERLGVSVMITPYRGRLNTYDGGLLDGSLSTKLRAGARILQFNFEARDVLSKADILWVDEIRSYLSVLPYILLARPTVIWNIGLLKESGGLMSAFHEVALRSTTYVFIESRTQAKRMFTDRQYDKFSHKFVVFHKGIDTERFSPAPRTTDTETVKIGTAALIHPRKGLHDLLVSFSELDEENVELHIAGETAREDNEAYLERLELIVDEKDMDDSVVFHGWVDDMNDFYNMLDIFVLPSYNEGIPGSIREAMSMELPVIATDVGGTSDLVDSRDTGILIEPGDTAELTNAMSYLIDKEDLRRKMGTKGRQKILDDFSIESYVRNYESFLDNIHQSGWRARDAYI